MEKHTAGPWTDERVGLVTGHEKGMAFRILGNSGDPKKFEVATVYYKPTIEEAKANARLIAAAPELLEVLHWIDAQRCGNNQRVIDYSMREKVRAAIAKAEA